MTGSSGGGQTTTTQSGPPPQVLQAYQNLTDAAKSQAIQPLQQYTGPIVAGFTPQQQQGFNEIGNAQGIGTPYLNAAAQEFGTATTPLWPTLPQYSAASVNQYLSPYTQDVTNALTNLYNNQNAQQQSSISGNAAMHGAYGGDREAVAQALAAQSENLAQAPTLAQVQQAGFQGAQGEFNTQQQQQLAAEQANAWLASQAGFGLAGLGQQAQTQALTGANALIGAGGMQQQLAQEQMNVPYQQFLQQQAYPYQQLGFLAPIVEGTGSLSGGTGSTTSPGPSTLSQIGGLGLAGAGIYGLGSQQGWWGGGSSFPSGATDYGSQFLNAAGDFSGAKRGGRIGYAMGGPIGIGPGVPNLDLSYIPQEAPGGVPSKMGLSPFQPDVKQTSTSSGGGGGALGVLGPLLSIGKFAAGFFADGGRIHLDDGGVVGLIGQEKKDQGHPGGIGLPAVPAINLDYISNPGPVVKGAGSPRGAGPPKPPSPQPAQQDQGLGNLIGEAKGLKDLGVFNGLGSSDTAAESAGGGIGLAQGGAPGEGNVPVSVAAQFGGAPPNVSGTLQQLMQLPMDRLQQMAVQFPPNTQQGQMIAQALARKKATLGAGTAPPAPQAPAPSGGMPSGGGSGPGQQQQQASGPAPEDYGGTAHAMAEGGAAGPGFVTEDDLDPHPIVDHSGDTVKIRYPSEGKVLDLGIPSIKERRSLAAGGASGATFPHAEWLNGQWSVNSPSQAPASGPTAITGPANNAPLLGTSQVESVQGTASPFTTSMPTANGVAVPQLSSQAFAPPTGVAPGGGIGNWFAPMAQYRPPGAGPTGPGGSMVFPSTTAYEPQMGNIYNALQPNWSVPAWAGGSSSAGASTASTAPAATSDTPTEQQLRDMFSRLDNSSATDKRGGRVGLAEGGLADVFSAGDPDKMSPVERSLRLGRSYGEGDTIRSANPARDAAFDAERPATAGPQRDDAINRAIMTMRQYEAEDPVSPRMMGQTDLMNWPNASYAEGGDVPAVPMTPDQALAEKIKRIEDLHRENVEDPFPSFQRIIGIPTGRPGGGGFAEGGTPDPEEYIEPPPKNYEPPHGIGGWLPREDKEQPQPFQGKRAEPPHFDAGGDVDPASLPPVDFTDPASGMPMSAPAGSPPTDLGVVKALKDIYSTETKPAWLKERYDKPPLPEPKEVVIPETVIPPKPSGGIGAQPVDTSSFDTNPMSIGVPASGLGAKAGTGEPSAPAAMVTPDRAPPAGLSAPPLAGSAARAPDQPPEAGTIMVKPDQPMHYQPTEGGGGWKLVPGPASATAAPAAGLARDASGDLTLNGRPPDNRISGQAAWEAPANATPQPPPAVAPDQVVAAPPVRSAAPPEGSAPATPTWSWDQAAPVIARFESPQGNVPNFRYDRTHTASGYYQITDTNWRNVAPKLGIDTAQFPTAMSAPKDAQGAVAKAMFEADQARGGTGFGDWAPYNPKLAAFLGSGSRDPTGGGSGVMTASYNPPGGAQADGTTPPVQQAAAIAEHTLAQTAPEHRGAMAQWMNSPYFLAFLAGAGMLASRSPFPGVALGEGLKLAAQGGMQMVGQQNKQEIADIRAQHLSDLTAVRSSAMANQATNQANMMQYRYENLAREAQRDQSNLDLKTQVAAAAAALNEAKLEEQRRKLDEAREYHQAIVNRPPPGLAVINAMMGDPNDPDRPKTVDEAQRRIAAAKQSPQAQAKLNLAIETQARLWVDQDQKAFSLNPQNFGRTFNSEGAYRQHLATLQQGVGGAPAQAPAAQPAAPGTVTQPTPGSAGAPAWARGSTSGPNGVTIYTDGKSWFNADHTPYQAAQ